MTKTKITLISHNQFGYQISHLKYAQYLKSKFIVEYLCLDYGMPKIDIDGIQVSYLKQKGNRIFKLIRFSLDIVKILKKEKQPIALVKFFPFCSIIPLLTKSISILDIQTASVTTNFVVNAIFDSSLKIESLFFSRITILSESLKIRLNLKKAMVVPLGADIEYLGTRNFNEINLIYIGTFENRRMPKTIEGLSIFMKKNKDIKVTYTIIGEGEEEQEMKETIKKLKLGKYIKMEGYIHHSKISSYLSRHNIGVSFVPITKYYHYQPATKTYEYLASGIPVIATKTYENQKIINDTNGVLIKDTPEDFSQGLEKIWQNRTSYNSKSISKPVEQFTYKNATLNILAPIIEEAANLSNS